MRFTGDYILFNSNIYEILKEIRELSHSKSKSNYKQRVATKSGLSYTCVINNLKYLEKMNMVDMPKRNGRNVYLNLTDKGIKLLNVLEEVKKIEDEK